MFPSLIANTNKGEVLEDDKWHNNIQGNFTIFRNNWTIPWLWHPIQHHKKNTNIEANQEQVYYVKTLQSYMKGIK